jgi:hypothetical protein
MPLFAEEAKRRDGGSGSSSVGARHHSGDSRSAPGASRGSGRVSSPHSSRSDSSSVALTDAQRRHPRAGTGTGSRYGYPGRYSGRYYGGYYSRYPYYRSYYYPYYHWGYGYYPFTGLYFDSWWWTPPYYGHGAYVRTYRDTGSVRLLVDERKARVYVDGYYAGIVDDYDGLFQRLHISPGHHDITLKLEGYKTHNFSVYVPYDGTLKLRWEMEHGEGHDGTGDPTLAPPRREGRPARYEGEDYERRDAERERARDEARLEDREGVALSEAERSSREEPVGSGTVRFEVRPSDASIYVDGAFQGTGRDLRQLELKAGSHRVEIVKPGYRTYERDVTVAAAEFVDLNVELER